MAFFQAPPVLANQYDGDPLLREYLERTLPVDARSEVESELRHLGDLAATFHEESLRERTQEPELVQWDPWGHRIDQIEVTPLWKKAARVAAEHGLVAAGYEDRYGSHARTHQFAMNYVISPSTDVYSCPLAMTDGATRTLLDLGNSALIDRAVGRLTSRDPERMWTSGQWMTERTGGSDVGISETVARMQDGQWRLYGNKWFTSAITADMALTLGRPEGNQAGGRGLALFYVEIRNDDGSLNGIQVNRLKDKLGTRKVPTAELTLEGTIATPVVGLENGIRNIASMLNITRVWNSTAAAAGARRAIALVQSYADKRVAFGKRLAEKPLHIDTVAAMAAQQEAIFHLTFRTIELIGRVEAGLAGPGEQDLLRLLTPVAKLTTAKQAVALASEALEAFGGAGYVEDTGLPTLLRDAQVLPIWEGTTNVLSLDTLRALGKSGAAAALLDEVQARLHRAKDPSLAAAGGIAAKALEHAQVWLGNALEDPAAAEAGARRFALTVGQSLQLALMIDHAQWCLDQGRGPRAAAAARRFSRTRIDLIDQEIDMRDAAILAAG